MNMSSTATFLPVVNVSLGVSYILDTLDNVTTPRPYPESASITTHQYIVVWVTIVNALLFLIGVAGNTLVIAVVVRVREMRTPTNCCLLNLSIADLLVLLICQTSALLEFYAQDRWLLGKVMCRIVPFLENVTMHASILIMLAVSLGRYYAVCHPLRTYSNCSRSRALMVVCMLWAVAFFSALPFVIITDTEQTIWNVDGSLTDVCRTHIQYMWHYVYIVVMFGTFFVVPLVLLTFVYCKIIREVMVDKMEIDSMKGSVKRCSKIYRRQLVTMLIGIIILFFVCMLPFRAITLWLIFTPISKVARLGLEGYLNLTWLSRILLYVNSAGNPIIYNMCSVKFRNAFKRCLGFKKPRLGTIRRRTISMTQDSFIAKGEKQEETL